MKTGALKKLVCPPLDSFSCGTFATLLQNPRVL